MPVPACGSKCACEGASSEVEVSPRARRNPLEGGVSPRARRNPLEGGVSPRAEPARGRRSPLEGAFDWATPVGRGGHRSVGHALCACLGKRCVLLLFFAGFKQDSPDFLGDPQGCPDSSPRASAGMPARLPQMLTPTDRTSFPPGCKCLPWDRVSGPAGLAC
jgi:hypothetical protein